MIRRLGAFAALLAMLVGPPLLLAVLGAYDWSGVSLWTPSDVRLLLLVLTAVGWVAWLLFALSVVVELAAVASRGRVRVRLPGLGAGQAVAASLLAAILAAAPLTATAAPAPAPATAASAPAVVERAARASDAEAVMEQATTDPGHLRHTVAAGDDLWSLAQHYYGDGTRWRSIVEANPRLAADPLVELAPGSTLRIVDPVELVTVQQGDTLWALAERHLGDGQRWPEVFALNRARIADPDRIQAGWVLGVPRATVAAPPAEEAPVRTEPPVPAESAAAAPAPGEAPFPETADASETTEAAPVGALAGRLTTLTAGAVLAGLAVARRVQAASRPLGRRYVQPDDELRRVETALAVRHAGTADPPQRALDREVLLDRALRLLSAHWLATREPVPALEQVVLGDVDVEFVFVADQPGGPPGFQHRGRRLAVAWPRLAALTDADHPVAYPALVTLGQDAAGDLHLVDLLAAGVLGVEGGSAAEALSALVVELASAPWASGVGLLVVSSDAAFAEASASLALRCTSSVEEGVSTLERLALERGRFLTDPDAYDRARLDPDLAEAWSPQVVVFETPPDADAVARVRAAVGRARCGLAAVLPAPSASGLTTWRLEGPDAVRGTLVGAGGCPVTGPLAPQTIPVPSRAAIARLHGLAQDAASHPAPWWASDDPKEPAVNLIALRPGPTTTGPLLRLLGPVVLEGATGPEPSRAPRQCLEYCAWLLEHPGATASQMTAELLVAETTRRSNMSRLRSWLGADAAGAPYLPDAYSGRIHLHEAVASDWQRLQELTVGGVNRASTERLVAALELVRGAPLADAAPGQWHWAEGLRADMVGLVRDAGVVLAARARAERNFEQSRWAANRALVAAPDDELLLGERVRTEYAAGRLDEVERLAGRLHHTARTLGVDLLPETVDLLQEVLEGRLRARRA